MVLKIKVPELTVRKIKCQEKNLNKIQTIFFKIKKPQQMLRFFFSSTLLDYCLLQIAVQTSDAPSGSITV
jgi:hypothetical protein